MKNKKIVWGVLFLVIVLFSLFAMPQIAEMQKEAYLDSVDEFVKDIGQTHNGFTKSDWERVDREYLKLLQEDKIKFEKLLTKEDIKRISKLEGEFAAYRTGGFFDNIIETTYDVIDNSVKYLDGLVNGIKTKLEKDTIDE